jgi:hypothetical protein
LKSLVDKFSLSISRDRAAFPWQFSEGSAAHLVQKPAKHEFALFKGRTSQGEPKLRISHPGDEDKTKFPGNITTISHCSFLNIECHLFEQ